MKIDAIDWPIHSEIYQNNSYKHIYYKNLSLPFPIIFYFDLWVLIYWISTLLLASIFNVYCWLTSNIDLIFCFNFNMLKNVKSNFYHMSLLWKKGEPPRLCDLTYTPSYNYICPGLYTLQIIWDLSSLYLL